MKRPTFTRIAAIAAFLGASLTALAEPQWIWLSKNAKPNEQVTLTHEFTLAGDVKSATLSVSVDKGAILKFRFSAFKFPPSGEYAKFGPIIAARSVI